MYYRWYDKYFRVPEIFKSLHMIEFVDEVKQMFMLHNLRTNTWRTIICSKWLDVNSTSTAECHSIYIRQEINLAWI